MAFRVKMIYVHLILSALFLPMLLLMPLTGTLYLWGFKGEQDKTEAFRIQASAPTDEAQFESFFRQKFHEQNIDFRFEQVRGGKNEFSFRPSTRVHYSVSVEGSELIFYKLQPNLLRRLIELHKGHGPRLMRWFEASFGISLILVTLSGLWLAISAKPYRKPLVISFLVGASVIAFCLI